MNETRGFKTLEKRYGVKVVSEGVHFNPLTNKTSETFKIYSADKCKWENGLSRAGVKKECEKWARQLLEIKEKVENARS